MFGTPARTSQNNEAVFYVPLKEHIRLGAEFTATTETVDHDISQQPKFQVLQTSILSGLTQHKELFRNPPTLESLQAICPNWGIVYNSDGTARWNPYMEIVIKGLPPSSGSAHVDLVLEGVYMSRSTIRPRFVTHFLKTADAGVIDFDWGSGVASPQNDCEEVSDIDASAEGTIAIKDPATRAREKAEAKEAVRSAFHAADAAREHAENLAARFHSNYDLSDSESAFSEWMSDDDTDSDE